jgi:hypothetical protein
MMGISIVRQLSTGLNLTCTQESIGVDTTELEKVKKA